MQVFHNMMQENGLKVQKTTLTSLLTGYAKIGSIEDITSTFNRFSELKITLLNRDVLEVIFELYVNGHDEVIEPVVSRLCNSLELSTSLESFVENAVHRKFDGVLHKLLKIFDELNRITLATLYVKALRDAPAQQIEEVVEVIEDHGITLQSDPSVFETVLQSNSKRLIRAILDDMKTKSLPIEGKHFWKLIELEGANGTDGVLNVVHSMKRDFNVEPEVYTIRDVILPCMNVAADPYLAFARLRTIELNSTKVMRSLFERCLMDGNMKVAYEIANEYKWYQFNVKNLQNSLINAFLATDDELHFVKIIKILQFCLSKHVDVRRDQPKDSESAPADKSNPPKLDEEFSHTAPTTRSTNQDIFIGNVLRDAIAGIKRKSEGTKKVESLLRAFKREGLTISPHFAHKIQTICGKINDESVEILESLSTGDSKPVSLDVVDKRFGTLDLLSSDDLEKMIGIKEETGSDTIRRKILFNAYIKEKNLVKIDELAKTGILHNQDYSRLIDLVGEIGSVDQVFYYWKQVRETKPNFKLLRYQVARLGLNMLKAKHEWSEIIRSFTENKQERPPSSNQDFFSIYWKKWPTLAMQRN